VRLWRISDFANLSGEGGLLAPARWHSQGRRIVYLADHPASALIETIVHFEVDRDQIPNQYQLLAVEVAEDTAFESVDVHNLPTDWPENLNTTRTLGDEWLDSNRTALLRVPSVIVPHASNWLLNPAHADAAKVTIAQVIRAPFDARLFR
jgi:RES domain-containing protein